MKSYIVIKSTGKGTKTGRSAVVKVLGEKGKNVRVAGNIPELFTGMIINLELLPESNKVKDYKLILSERNLNSLEKAGVNTTDYSETLRRHTILKENGIGWNVAALGTSAIYEILPFGEADKVHKETVDDAEEKIRLAAINKEIITNARNRRKIAYKIEEYLGYFDDVEQEGAYQHLMTSLKIMCLQASKYSFRDGSVWDKEIKDKEDFVRQNIKERKLLEYNLLSAKEIKEFIDMVKDSELEEEQLATLWSLKTSVPCVITGSAGCGKTFVIQTIINCYSKFYDKDKILLIAPTGKASRRLAEKTGMPASTIHRALRKNPEEDEAYYNESNLLPHRLIVVDESSMIDTWLMSDLLKAVDMTSKIIFVGDHNQLYPVGYGEPFFDFLKNLEVFKLTINHRQAEGTDILENANGILVNKPIHEGRGVKVEHLLFSQIGDVLDTNDARTQIISPYNQLNAQINAYLKKGSKEFNVGDKIIAIKNTKEYCNGDIGYIKNIDCIENTITIIIDNRTIIIPEEDKENIMLAYSITVHKMQGSEAERIIFLLPETEKMIDKRLLYTAVTRARKELEIYYYTEE